jgi:hypothetical protein
VADHLVKMSADVMDQLWERAKNAGGDSLAFVVFANACAQWGADQELEACCEWLGDIAYRQSLHLNGSHLRAARRPKPPTLAEQGMEALRSTTFEKQCHYDAMFAALKRLAELEPNQ